jgi:hypothetical protein
MVRAIRVGVPVLGKGPPAKMNGAKAMGLRALAGTNLKNRPLRIDTMKKAMNTIGDTDNPQGGNRLATKKALRRIMDRDTSRAANRKLLGTTVGAVAANPRNRALLLAHSAILPATDGLIMK